METEIAEQSDLVVIKAGLPLSIQGNKTCLKCISSDLKAVVSVNNAVFYQLIILVIRHSQEFFEDILVMLAQ